MLPDASNNKSKDDTAEISDSVIEDIKHRTQNMFQATVSTANKEIDNMTSSNEYLMVNMF